MSNFDKMRVDRAQIEPTPEELAEIDAEIAAMETSIAPEDEPIDTMMDAVGDELVGGTAPTPDQDLVDQLGEDVGMEMDDRAFLRSNEILEGRDDRRWELEPKSSEDYSDRRAEEED
jgi:Family of unknown function (DUF6335)